MSDRYFDRDGVYDTVINDYASTSDIVYKLNKISDLEAKLAEKDKEIEKLTEELDDKNFCKDFVDLYTENKLKTQLLHENWKDKISFAIEQLKKMKYDLLDISSPYWQYFSKSGNAFMTYEYIEQWTKEFIDNKIKELKDGDNE